MFLPCLLLRRFLPCRRQSLGSSDPDSSLLDSDVSSSGEEDDELDDDGVYDEEEELGLDGDLWVRLGPLERPIFLNALPR